MKIGIRREDKNIWEGRVPLIPADIKELKQKYNLKFVVQPSTIRAFSDEEFLQAGAEVREDLSDCNLIIAVKEIPVNFFQENKKYLFFSHTIKGQKENIPILKKVMEKKSTLMDYEKIVDDNNHRLVFFGKYAGIAGMIDSFYGYGQKLKSEGIATPFEKMKYATDYKDLNELKKEYAAIANEIKSSGLPFPVIIGIAGYGNVSQGAQEIIDLLPCTELTPEELYKTHRNTLATDRIYKVVFKEEDMVEPVNPSGRFDLLEYYHQPHKYQSKFYQYLPQLNILINGIYWDHDYPRLVECGFLEKNFDKLKKLKIIGDISCDVDGGVECTRKSTNSGAPFFVYEPDKDDIKMGLAGNGPAILAVDNLPGEISRDSATFFSKILKNYMPLLRNGNMDGDWNDLKIPDELKKAVIIHKGELTPNFKYLGKYL